MKLDSGLAICAAQTHLPRVISSVFTGRHEETLALRNTWRLNTRHSVYPSALCALCLTQRPVCAFWSQALTVMPEHEVPGIDGDVRTRSFVDWRSCPNTKGDRRDLLYTQFSRRSSSQIVQPVLGLPGQTRSVLVFGQTLSGLNCLIIGQTRWFLVLAGLDQFLFWPLSVLVLARLDRFLPWSVRLYHFLSCPESISSCPGQNLSVNKKKNLTLSS